MEKPSPSQIEMAVLSYQEQSDIGIVGTASANINLKINAEKTINIMYLLEFFSSPTDSFTRITVSSSRKISLLEFFFPLLFEFILYYGM